MAASSGRSCIGGGSTPEVGALDDLPGGAQVGGHHARVLQDGVRVPVDHDAPEIAGEMLRRQQAAAVVAARQLIVQGALGMVDGALREMESTELVDLSPEQRAQLVSNLLVVLVSDRGTQPVVNAGT